MIEKLRGLIFRRRMAYRHLFAPGPASDIVLADLARFCHATRPTTIVSPISRQVDPIASAIAEGRREVWLRLQAHLNLSDEVVMNLKEQQDD
jgi:hypothetical protein